MKSCNNGVEALVTGNFDIVKARTVKETYGLLGGKVVLILWDIRGKEFNADWKRQAIKNYQIKKIK